jgi:hypothetical protein
LGVQDQVNYRWRCQKAQGQACGERLHTRAGSDFTEMYSPVARFDTIHAVLNVAASEKLSLAHFDVKTAFLNGDLDEVIYMKQPTGYEDGTNRVCMLKKSLYGLKQAPRCWNRKFTAFLDKYGLQCSEADPCLFINSTEGHELLIALYVDDGLVAAQNATDLQICRAAESTKEQMKLTSRFLIDICRRNQSWPWVGSTHGSGRVGSANDRNLVGRVGSWVK